MNRGYSDAPVTNLNRKPKVREENWFDRIVQYLFFMVLGAFIAIVSLKLTSQI